jgi:hypothetical protein
MTHHQTNKNGLKSHVWFKWDQGKGRVYLVQKEPGSVPNPTLVKQPAGMPKLLGKPKKGELAYEMTTGLFKEMWPAVKLRGSLTHERIGDESIWNQ